MDKARRRPLIWGCSLLVVVAGATGISLALAGSQAEGPRFQATNVATRTLPPGSQLPSGRECAQLVRRNLWEPRVANKEANNTTGHRITRIGGLRPSGRRLMTRIDGDFTGTTNEIIEWAACKWGIDADTLRSQAVEESFWNQSQVGDEGQSFGLLQIKASQHPGTYPTSVESTAFNVDYGLARWRMCFEGDLDWLPPASVGDKWGCIGVHFSGRWLDNGARKYISRVKEQLRERQWVDWPDQSTR
jgi:hypothetical protein